MGKSSGSDSTTQITKQEPPAWLKPYITGNAATGTVGVLPTAQQQFQQGGASYFPGSTVAPFTTEQQAGLQMGANRAMSGSPLNAAAGGYLQNVLGGQYLNAANPNDSALWDSIQNKVLPGVNSQFSMAGRYGSGAHAGALSEGLTNAYAPYAFNQYNQERGLQQQAASMAPGQASTDYQDINALLGYGGMAQQQGQAELGDVVNRYNYYQNLPQQQLQQYANYVYGSPSGMNSTTTGTQPSNQPSGSQQAISAIMSAAAIASMFSNAEFKDRVERLTDDEVLDKAAQMDIGAWFYKGGNAKHIGIMAQDFQRIWGVGDGKTILFQDALGAVMATQAAIARRMVGGR